MICDFHFSLIFYIVQLHRKFNGLSVFFMIIYPYRKQLFFLRLLPGNRLWHGIRCSTHPNQ